jgi:hypothetical protein
MKKLFSLFAILSLAVGFTACEKSATPDNPTPQDVTLSADKGEILADGTDVVTFTVAPAEAQIVCLNDNSVLGGTTFTTTTAGEYRFVAVFNGQKSPEVKVLATNPKGPTVVLAADKSGKIKTFVEDICIGVLLFGADIMPVPYSIINVIGLVL